MRELLERAAAALFALATLFTLWTVGVLGFALVVGGMGLPEALLSLLLSGGIAGAAFLGVWLLRRYARRLPTATPPHERAT